MSLRTERLLLRPWQDSDLPALTALNADPAVMAHFPAVLNAAASAAFIARMQVRTAQDGFAMWAVEAPGVAACIGTIGLLTQGTEFPFGPAVEIGWRLARPWWGHGYAVEGARAWLNHGFGQLALREIVAMTVPGNTRSQAVMRRLGMTRNPADDFDHPKLPPAHLLRRHVLYRISP